MEIDFRKFKEFADKRRLYCFLVLLTVLLICTLGIMECLTDRSVLRIAGTGEKNDESFGTDIRITSIYVNERPLTTKDVKLKGQWEVTDGCLMAFETDEATWIEIPFRATDRVKVTFWLQHGSGYISIKKNGQLVEEWDLYAPTAESAVYVEEKTMQITPLQQLLPFLALVEGLILEYLLLYVLLRKWKGGKKAHDFLHPLLLVLGASGLYLCVELIDGNLSNVGFALALENILIYLAMMLVVYIVTARVSWSVGTVSAAWLIFAVANYYVTIFRGTPITPGDLLTLQTAANVAGNYQYDLTMDICYGLIIFTLFFAVICRLAKMGVSRKGKQRVFLCPAAIILALVILKSDLYCKKMDLWNVKGNIAKYGLGVNLVSGIHNMRVDPPKDYAAEKVKGILKQYAQEENGFNPNIVVIMNEAFSDLSVVAERLDSDLYMPYFNSLRENVVKGVAVSSVIGGMTANSEYEFLTGNSMYFLQNQVPYQQHIYRDAYSLVGVLKERGYTAAAIHPYLASGYNRPSAYPHLGFDAFLSIDDFSDYELVRSLYVSDGDSYKKVIEVFEEIQQTGTPAFIFNVTMQNHSAYQTGYYGDDVIRVPGYEGQFPDVEEYLTLIRESDEALSVLVDYFSRVGEPTVILLFGDHQPAIDSEFYESALGKEKSDFTLEDIQKTYEVPFLIWANYDIEEEQGVYTSLNYLSAVLFEKTGVSCTPYQNYLLQMRATIPAINKNGYMDNGGGWHAVNEDTDLLPKVNEYWDLEYYHIFEADRAG